MSNSSTDPAIDDGNRRPAGTSRHAAALPARLTWERHYVPMLSVPSGSTSPTGFSPPLQCITQR